MSDAEALGTAAPLTGVGVSVIFMTGYPIELRLFFSIDSERSPQRQVPPTAFQILKLSLTEKTTHFHGLL